MEMTTPDYLFGGTTQKAIQIAIAQVGKPYVYGTEGPNTFDCSGLLWYAFKKAGAKVGVRWTTFTMLASMQKIKVSQAMPGDFLFPHSGHVAMKINSSQIVEAACTKCGPVRIMPLNSRKWVFARRFLPPGAGVDNADSPYGDSTTPFDGLPIVPDLVVIAKTIANTHFWLRSFTMAAGVVLVAVVVGRMSFGTVSKGVRKIASGNSNRSSGIGNVRSSGGNPVQPRQSGQASNSGTSASGSGASSGV